MRPTAHAQPCTTLLCRRQSQCITAPATHSCCLQVVYTACATNVIQVELKRVEEQGVANMAKALAVGQADQSHLHLLEL